MDKKTVLVTGATGNMGYQSLLQMKGDLKNYNIRLVARDSEKNHKILAEYEHLDGLEIVWGDLDDYEIVKKAVRGVDLILHIAAFVSPFADYYPKKAMIVNYGSTYNLIQAIKVLHSPFFPLEEQSVFDRNRTENSVFVFNPKYEKECQSIANIGFCGRAADGSGRPWQALF